MTALQRKKKARAAGCGINGASEKNEGHITAQEFVSRNEGLARCIVNSFRRSYSLKEQDVEDLVSVARIALLGIPLQYRPNYNYVKVALKNRITDGWRRMKKYEREAACGLFREEAGQNEGVACQGDSTIEGREFSGTPHAYSSALSAEDDICERLEEKDKNARLHLAIRALPDTERTVITLLFGINGERMSVKRIAVSLGHRDEWVKKRHAAALRRLNEAMKNYQ